MRKRAENDAWIILGLTLILTVFFVAVDIKMMDDGFLYEEFAEKIVEESVHDYNPVNPAYIGRLFHVTPIVTFFAIANLLYPKVHFKSNAIFFGVALSAFAAFILPALVVVGGTADPFSLEPLALFFIIVSSVTFAKYRRYFGLVIVLSSFQFFYCYLWGKGSWWSASNPAVFLLYFVVSGIAFVYTKDEFLSTVRQLIRLARQALGEAKENGNLARIAQSDTKEGDI